MEPTPSGESLPPEEATIAHASCKSASFCSFFGHQCDHFTFPNQTEHTRLSLDFRVVPRSHFLEHYENSHHRNGQPRFGIDAFYAVLEPEDGTMHSHFGAQQNHIAGTS